LRYAYGTLLFAPTYRPPQSGWVLEQVLYGQLIRLSSLRESGYARLLAIDGEFLSCSVDAGSVLACYGDLELDSVGVSTKIILVEWPSMGDLYVR